MNPRELTEEIINEIKQSLPEGISISKFSHPKTKFPFVLRALYPEDLEKIQTLYTSGLEANDFETNKILESYVYKACVLWPSLSPEEEKMMPIGIKPEIVNAVTYLSGYISVAINGDVVGPPKNLVPIYHVKPWGAPTEDEANEVLATNSQYSLSKVRVGDYHFIIRPVVGNDMSDVAFIYQNDIHVVDRCVVWPDEFEIAIIPRGILLTTAQIIRRLSGETYEIEITEL